jgi:hypothetical protein
MESPQKGFYIHYKHDPAGALYNYHYEVTGLAKGTEDDSLHVLYRPLYASEWMAPADYTARPLGMFTEIVEKDGMRIPRFVLITDPDLIRELVIIKKKMYGML